MANIVSVSNPVFSSEDGTMIDCMLQLDVLPNPVPFTAFRDDVEEHGRKIYNDLISGVYGPIAAYVPPPPPVQASVAPVDVQSGPPQVI
jgi:hypothetical protein